MKAYVLKAEKTLTEEDRALPKCASGEALVKVTACGICRTDRKAWSIGQRDLHMPRILGHEIVGVVEAVGSDVDSALIGTRILVHPGVFCGECEYCREGRDQLCGEMRILGFHTDGGFAEYCLIPKEAVRSGCLIPIPNMLDDLRATLAEPIACALNMMYALETTKDDFSVKRLLIFGGGALGFITALLWKHRGLRSEHITIVEPNEQKRKLLREHGFDSVDTDSLDNTYDIAINCCPDPSAFETAIKHLKAGGSFGYFSGLTGDTMPSISALNLIHYKELHIVGSYGCALKHTKEAAKLLALGLFSDIPIEIIAPKELSEHIKQSEKDNSVVSILKL